MKQLIILTTLLVTILSHSAGADEFNVLWEIDFSPHAGYVLVSDDGKYFYYCDSGYVKFHDSETGNLINQIPDRKFLLLGWQDYYLNNDRVVLPFTLDSILIYNIATQQTEETIDLGYNVEEANIRWVSLSPNKRFMTMLCFFEETRHLIIIDLEEKRLYKDLKVISYYDLIFNTNDPNRMIVSYGDQHGKHLMEMTLDETAPLGYKRNIFEEVDTEGEIRGQKYDVDEDAFYYLSLPDGGGHKLIKYNLQTSNKTTLLDWGKMNNVRMWYSDDNSIFASEKGFIRNLLTDESIVFVELPPDGKQHTLSSCSGLETILLRDYTSLQVHKLRRLEVDDFLTDIETSDNYENSISPNPTNASINLSFTNQHPSAFHYEVISNSGQVVQSAGLGYLLIEANSINLDISTIANGKYSLRIFSDREEFVFNVIKGE